MSGGAAASTQLLKTTRSTFPPGKVLNLREKVDSLYALVKKPSFSIRSRATKPHRQFYDHKLAPHVHIHAVALAACFLLIFLCSSCDSCNRSHRLLAPA